MRWTVPALAALIALVLLTACTSRPHLASVSPSSDPGVVDGITIPPAYVTPAGTVVPGPTTCPADFAATVSAAAAGAAFTLRSELASHLLTCTYQAAAVPTGGCSQVTVRVNTEPQAYTAFDRWAVETGQVSIWTNNPALQPTPVYGIGTKAEWAPGLLELGAGNDTTWVSVILTCPASTPPVLALAEKLAIEGLASSA